MVPNDFFLFLILSLYVLQDKVISIMMIMMIEPLDDRTYCARSAFRSLIWSFGGSCTIGHCITSQSAKCENVPY